MTPPESDNPVIIGVLVHLGPPAGLALALAWFGMSWLTVAVAYGIASILSLVMTWLAETRAPAAELDPPSREAVGFGLVVAFVQGVGLGGLVVSGVWWLGTRVWPYVDVWSGGWAVLAAVALDDLAYYSIHRWLYHGRGRHRLLRMCRRIHARHHAVSHLDFLRGNVASLADTAITSFQIPLGLIAVALGIGLQETLIAYLFVLMFQVTDHVNYTPNLGPLRHVFIDNHAHKLHHCKGGTRLNYAVVFAFWDKLFGSYYENWGWSPSHMYRDGISVGSMKGEVERG